MGFLSSLFGRSAETAVNNKAAEQTGPLPELYNGMTLDLETPDGQRVLTGRLAGYNAGDTTLTVERQPGALSLALREPGASLVIRGVDEGMTQFFLKGTLKDVKVKVISEHRTNFRLQMGIPAALHYESDVTFSNPEVCTLVDISTGGACLESEYLHAEDEVLRLKIKLLDYTPMDFLGEIIRVVEYQPGKFRYGFLFAQLAERELTELTRTLYNIQVGNRTTWMRTESGHW